MPRPRKHRRVKHHSGVDYFKPQGVPLKALGEVFLYPDEFEALRLSDLKGLTQSDAAEKMGVSQSTFFRLLKSARTKVSAALIEGKAIRLLRERY